MRMSLISCLILCAAAANEMAAAEVARPPLPAPHISVQLMMAAKQAARTATPPAPQKPPAVMLPLEPELDWDDTPAAPPLPLPEPEFKFETKLIIGYRKQCIDGICTNVPIYAPIEEPKPGHTHEALDGAVCNVCGQSCYMLRAAEAAARAKGDVSNAAVQEEYSRMYGSGKTVRTPLFRRWRH